MEFTCHVLASDHCRALSPRELGANYHLMGNPNSPTFLHVEKQLSLQFMNIYNLILVTKLHWLDWLVSGIHEKYNVYFKSRQNIAFRNCLKEHLENM